MPYNLAPRLFPKDIPAPCSKDVEAILEVDRLFWLDPKNTMQKQFERALVPGEEHPYQLSAQKDKHGNSLVVVLVTRHERTFLYGGKPVLILVDNPPELKKKLKKEKQDHGIQQALDQFRKFMGQHFRQSGKLRGRGMEGKPTSDERQAQSERDKQRTQERRQRNAARRSALIAAKQEKRKSKTSRSTDTRADAT